MGDIQEYVWGALSFFPFSGRDRSTVGCRRLARVHRLVTLDDRISEPGCRFLHFLFDAGYLFFAQAFHSYVSNCNFCLNIRANICLSVESGSRQVPYMFFVLRKSRPTLPIILQFVTVQFDFVRDDVT